MTESQLSPLVRALQTQLRQAGLPEPEYERRFHPTRKWRFDLSWEMPGRRVAAEVHGSTWTNGRHTRGSGFENDRRKMAEAQLAGWTVIEVTAGMIASGEAVALIERALGVTA